MPAPTAFKDRSYAYCGSVTGRNEREDVIPLCVIPLAVRGAASLVKVPSCPACNDGFSKDEPHFRSVVAAAGLNPCDGRKELFARAERSFNRRGTRDFAEFYDRLVETADAAQFRIFPGKDRRVLNVVRKIARGLCHWLDSSQVVSAERVFVDVMRFPIPPWWEQELKTVHELPDTVRCRVQLFGPGDTEFGFTSAWLIKFFHQLEFIAVVSEPGRTPSDARA